MLKVISQPAFLRKVFLQPLLSHFVLTAQHPRPQETSFHDDFEFSMDNQIFKSDSSPKKPLNITDKDLDILASLSNGDTASQMNLGLNKARALLNHLAYKNDDINLSNPQLKRAAESLKEISLSAMDSTNSYDHNILKLFFLLAQGNLFANSKLIEMLSFIMRKDSIVATLNFENVANILLLLTDLKKLSAIQLTSVQEKDNLKLIMKKLQTQIENILDQTSPSEYSFRFFLPKILFCFLQLDPKNKLFLNKLLSHLLYCDLSALEETEVTSLLYIVIKMEKKLHILTEETKDSFSLQLHDLYNQLQQIIRERISKQLLHFKRVPYILYCLAMIGRCSQTVLDDLMKLFVTNMESYALSEVCTVMYCLWRMPELDPHNRYIVDIISFYFDKNRANLERLSNTNLYSAFLGVRKPLKERLEDKQKKKLDAFLQDLLKVFTKNFEHLDDGSKIRILYEVTHMHKVIQRKMFFQEFIHFFFEMNLDSLNNHDLITVGYIMKKFIVVNKEHYDFWNKYLECLSNREWSAKIEENRITMIFTNLKDLVTKGIQVDPNEAKYRDEWLQNINKHYMTFMKNQQSLKMKGRPSNKVNRQ